MDSVLRVRNLRDSRTPRGALIWRSSLFSEEDYGFGDLDDMGFGFT